MFPSRVLSRQHIEARIAAGDTLVIFQDNVLRLNAWQDVHPGGWLVIQHMVGRDATDELSVSHAPEILKSMNRFSIGRINGPWQNFIPPIQGGVFRDGIDCGDKDVTLLERNSTMVPARSLDKNMSDCGHEQISVESVSSSTPTPVALRHRSKGNAPSAPRAAQGWKVEALPDSYAALAIQEALDADIARYPSLDADTQHSITLNYRALHRRVYDEGYYECRYSEYAKEMVRYVALFAVFLFFLYREQYVLSATFLGFWWQQIMFTAHDAGHRGITHNFIIDTLIGIFIGNFCCGLSMGWWKSSHNVHHVVPNHPVHDPDTQNIPLFSISPAFFSSVKSSYYSGFQFVWDSAADFFVQYQKWMYYPVMGIARFNLYYLSWLHLLGRRSIKHGTAAWTRPVEIVASASYIYVYFYLLLYRIIPTWQDALTFMFVSHLATLPLQIQITLSHWGTSTSDLGPTEAFAQRQLRTTMDVACPEWLDFIHGGLQFQVVHHLFPRVPRHNLRRLQVLVKEFCEENGIQHQLLGFVDGNRHVLSKLQQITDQAKMLAACHMHMAATGNTGLH